MMATAALSYQTRHIPWCRRENSSDKRKTTFDYVEDQKYISRDEIPELKMIADGTVQQKYE